MTAWEVHGVELPFGETRSWWVDAHGTVDGRPIDGAELLPGRYVLFGLVDAHAHPFIAEGPTGPAVLTRSGAHAALAAWAHRGVTLVRDVGSPSGLTLTLNLTAQEPSVAAAGRFLAPAGRYFPDLLMEPVSAEELIGSALGEVARGATWVKVIGDFPRVPEFTDTAPTYPVELIASLSAAVHAAGARVAVHSTLADVGPVVAAGVDSIEHGSGLDARTIEDMARRGVAWTPTACATLAALRSDNADPGRRQRAAQARERFRELLPLAVRLGVPVLAGTDVVGSIPEEVAMLAELGLEPAEALAAASEWARRFIAPDRVECDIVTYDHDPREDPAELARPRAVVMRGSRIV